MNSAKKGSQEGFSEEVVSELCLRRIPPDEEFSSEFAVKR